MPQQAWSNKRERQYEHIKSSARQRGESEQRAEEIAARTVNKNRARSGESGANQLNTSPSPRDEATATWSTRASRTSTQDISSQRRGGLRSGKGPGGPTKEQLYNEARKRNIKGRSKLTKRELSKALGR